MATSYNYIIASQRYECYEWLSVIVLVTTNQRQDIDGERSLDPEQRDKKKNG